jgi:hypothetical protein
MTLTETREQLVDAERYSYDPEDFPGSKGWRENQTARKALEKFDTEHPEIAAQAKADREAKEAARIAKATSGDVMGM